MNKNKQKVTFTAIDENMIEIKILKIKVLNLHVKSGICAIIQILKISTVNNMLRNINCSSKLYQNLFVQNVACIHYGLNELKLRFRTRLSYYLYSKYLKGFTYYKMSNLDNRISNPDQLLTQDVDKFCDTVAELYSNLSKVSYDDNRKPYFYYNLHSGPGVMLVYLAISGMILTSNQDTFLYYFFLKMIRLRRPIGKLTVQEQRLEGEYRFVNSRLITNSKYQKLKKKTLHEEIAFYQGNKREQGIILETFKRLVAHLRYFIFFRMQMGFLDNIIAKCKCLAVLLTRLNVSDFQCINNSDFNVIACIVSLFISKKNCIYGFLPNFTYQFRKRHTVNQNKLLNRIIEMFLYTCKCTFLL
ncbi:hypothetical protein KUTeg_016353 [Tegillarca granosa]|uniref:ABC transmembrane type-1 domain-containing protein n=1 Tax=Tegillarca granosa TaxID=220873 RepID=A0ABQ9EKL8_TEGGR|nr:hypothetical protein KUTeg_016353 [Tegillarca granosa]